MLRANIDMTELLENVLALYIYTVDTKSDKQQEHFLIESTRITIAKLPNFIRTQIM